MGRGDSARKRDGQSIAYVLPNVDNGVTVAVGTSSVFGAKSTIIPGDNDYEHLLPIKYSADVAAVSTETVTVRFIATDEDGNTKTLTKTTTSDAVIELDAADLADLTTDGKRITKIEVDAHTSDAAAGPTVTLDQVSLDYP